MLASAFSGTVVAALLNQTGHAALAPEVAAAAPHGGAPRRPVLAVRPPNTGQFTDDAMWQVPHDAQTVLGGPCLGVVLGGPLVRAHPGAAMDAVAAWVLCADGSWPVPNHYRPGLRWRARDGLCVMAPKRLARHPADDPARWGLSWQLDDQPPVTASPVADRIRGVAQLLADVSSFMSLHPGDVVLLGPAEPQPALRAGQRLSVHLHAGEGRALALSVRVGVSAPRASEAAQ
jgi:5-oxopent-3-ene-1,2,5-tricarboxylate decarboxylase / 2-hydroxyhepta-2,4-diene-1,7-dioate isomerase